MIKHWNRYVVLSCLLVFICGFFSATIAKVSEALIRETNASINTLRKRDAIIIVETNGTPLPEVPLSIKQIRHHFGFGAAIALWPFDTIGDAYGDAFLKYFEWATPENVQKWPYTDLTSDGPDYTKPDRLIDWCLENGLKVRGHNLFWNQRMEWMPEWVTILSTDEAKAAIDDRIENAMTHFKGRCAHWDIINELIHGQAGPNEDQGTLEVLTGDPNIYSNVLKEARKIDSESKFCVNDYNIISQWSDVDKFVSSINNLLNDGAPIEVIGCEGHFGDKVEENDIKQKLVKVTNINKEIWLTEVDFEIPESQIAEKAELLMRLAFAHESMGGIVLWAPWQGNLWRPTLTSFVVDSHFNETNMGKKWRELKDDEWSTDTSGTTDSDGKVFFNGFHGEYKVTATIDSETKTDTLYLEPGSDPQLFNFIVGIKEIKPASAQIAIRINGKKINVKLPATETKPLFLSAYSISGKLLLREPITIENSVVCTDLPAGCYIYRIGTNMHVYYTMVGLNLH